MVLGSHCKVTAGFPAGWVRLSVWLFDGSLGVRFFFVISGFLITWLMLDEKRRTGRVEPEEILHYVRRGLRILPVYCAFLCALAGLQIFTGYHLGTAGWLGNLTFTTNVWGGQLDERPPLVARAGGAVLPRMARALPPVLRSRPLGGVPWRYLRCLVVLAPVFRVLSYVKVAPAVDRITLGFSSCDSLAVGCVCAILFFRNRGSVEASLDSRGRSAAGAGAAMILVPYVLTKLFVLGKLTVPLGESCQALGIATLLLMSVVNPRLLPFRPLNWRWVREIGVLSYSIYIWQQIFCTKPADFGIGPEWWLAFPGWLVAAFAVATASYYGLEKPLLRLRASFRGQTKACTGTLMLTQRSGIRMDPCDEANRGRPDGSSNSGIASCRPWIMGRVRPRLSTQGVRAPHLPAA